MSAQVVMNAVVRTASMSLKEWPLALGFFGSQEDDVTRNALLKPARNSKLGAS